VTLSHALYCALTRACAGLNENSTVDNNATAEATLKSEQAAVLAAAALDTNDYIHVRTLYDPAGRSGVTHARHCVW
jgi:hypothetical protein